MKNKTFTFARTNWFGLVIYLFPYHISIYGDPSDIDTMVNILSKMK